MEMIIDLFLKQVKERPKRPSVTDMRGAYTYEELNRRSALLARKLIERGANCIVFGCNTLSVSALEYVRKRVVPPVFGLIPRPDLLSGKSLLLTTPTTALYLPKLTENVSLLTPAELASLLDREYPETRGTEAYLSPLILPYGDCEEVYLGCSHYLYAKEVIRRYLPHAEIADGVNHLAALVHAVLPACESKNPSLEMIFTGRDQTERYLCILAGLLK